MQITKDLGNFQPQKQLNLILRDHFLRRIHSLTRPSHSCAIVFVCLPESNQSTLMDKKYQWTRDEDTKLVECLLELVACRKWTGDNGTFRHGYLKQLEQWLHQKMPGCGLKANPHIESRVKQLKKQYCAIIEMLRASGFEWNDEKKMIVVENDLFRDWVKVHPNAADLFKKPFPHFDDLALVFGKDRAIRMDAENPNAVEVMHKEMQENVFFTGNNVGIDKTLFDSVAETQLSRSPDYYFTRTGIGASRGQDSTSSARRKKKRTFGNNVIVKLSETIQALGKVYESTNDNISDLVECFKHEKEGAERRMQVFEELKKVEQLTDMERVKAGFIITKDQSAIDFFFTIDPELKVLYVQQILATNIY